MKNVNLRLLALLGAGGLLVLLTMHYLHGLQVRRNASFLLQQARIAREGSQLREAVHQYDMYLNLVPDDVDARHELGFSLAQLGMNKRAFDALERVLRQDPERAAAQKRLVEVAMEMNRYTDARRHLEDSLLKASPQDGELIELLGRCQEAARQYDEAIKSYEDAITYKPEHLNSYLFLANLFRRQKRIDRADDCLERLVKANPTSAEAYVLRGEYRKSLSFSEEIADKKTQKDLLQKAAEDADQALQLVDATPLPADEKEKEKETAKRKSRRAAALLLAAQCAQKQGELAEAEKHAREGLRFDPRQALLYIALAEVEVARRHPLLAIQWLNQGLQAAPDQRDLLWGLANLEIDDRQIDEAQKTIERLREIDHPAPQVEYLEGRVLYAQGDWLACTQAFERMRERLLDSPKLLRQADYLLGNCYERLGNVDQQLTAYDRAKKADSAWIPVRLGIARALLSTGRIDEALGEYQEIVRSPMAPKTALVDMAGLLILKNLRLNRGIRDWQFVDNVLKEAEKAQPDSVSVPILSAEALVAQGKPAEAEQLLAAARGKFSGDVKIWIAQSALAQRREEWDKAERFLADAQQKFGDSLPLRLASARYLAQRGGEQMNARLDALANKKSPRFAEDDAEQLAMGLAVLAFQTGNTDLARKLCKAASEKAPSNLQVRLWLFDLAVRTGDTSGIGKNLDEIRRIEGPGALWHYGQAISSHASAKKAAKGEERVLFRQALEHLIQARALRPSWSRLPLLAGEIYDLQQNQDYAISNYLQAIELGERDLMAIRRVVDLLYKQERYLEADQVLRRLEDQQNPFSPDSGKMAAQISVWLGDDESALKKAQQVAASSKDCMDHIWFGQLLALMGQRAKLGNQTGKGDLQFAEAEKEFRAAIRLKEKEPATWVALIQFLGRVGQVRQSEDLIAEAQQKLPADKAPLALAQCYESLGKLDEAEKRYQAARDASPDSPDVLESLASFYLRSGKAALAEEPLKKLAEGLPKEKQRTQLWAQRNRAILRQASGDYRKLEEAKSFIEVNLKTPDPDPQDAALDQAAQARVLAAYPKRERRREAVAILEKLDRRQRLSLEDRFLLAQLYLRLNDWPNAARRMGSVAAQSGEPRYIAAYADALLKHNEVQEARLWIARLKQLPQADLLATELEAQAFAKSGQYGEALKSLKGFVDRADGQPKDSWDPTRRVALQLESLARQLKGEGKESEAKPLAAEAEALVRKYVEKQPDRSLVLAGFLGRQGRIDEALDVAERAWDKETPEAVAETLVALIAGTPGSDDQRRRIEKILTSALEKHKRPLVLLMVLAEFYSLEVKDAKRFDHIEAVYREILAKKPDDAVTLNNLAVLLAVQGKNVDKEAIELIDKAIALVGPLAALLDTRATVLLAQGKRKEAFAVLREAIDEEPVAVAYFHQAQVHLLLGQREQAGQALREAQRLGFRPEQLHPLERPAYEQLLKSIPNPST